MGEEQLRLVIGEPQPIDVGMLRSVTRQHVELLAKDTQLGSGSVVVAEADAQLKPYKCYSVNWFTRTSPGALIELTEKTVGKFENQFPEGVQTVDRNTEIVKTPKAEELLWKVIAVAGLDVSIQPRRPYRRGIILQTSVTPEGKGPRRYFPLQRPLSWERLERLSRREPISFVLLNTRVGSFSIERDREGKSGMFGFITNLAKTEPFAPLLELTAEEGVSHEKAMEFFTAVTGLFATGENGL